MNAGQVQELLYGVASQRLVLDSPRPLASVSSVILFEVGQGDDGQDEDATTGSATLGSATVSTTTTAGVADGDTLIPLTSASGFVIGRRYYLSKAGLGEVFELARLDGLNAYARHPLVNTYASGATAADSLRASIAVTDAWSGEKGNISANASPTARYRARWAVVYATLDGSTGPSDVLYTNVDLVRYGSTAPVSPLDVEAAYPGWLDSLGPDDRATQGEALIRESARAVKIDLLRRGIADQALRNAEVHADGVIRHCIWQRVENNVIRGGATTEAADMARARYDRWIEGLVAAPVLALDVTGSGGSTTVTGSGASLWGRLK